MEQDPLDNVRPVSPKFFAAVSQNQGLSLSAKENLVNEALSGRLQLDEARSRLVRTRQQEQLASLRIEREDFMLSRAREEARRDQQTVETSRALAGSLTGLLDDPDLTPEEKRNTMARIRLQNPDTFARNPGLRDQFSTLDSILPKPPRPLSVSEKIALTNQERAFQKDAIALERAAEKEQEARIKEERELFEESFKRVEDMGTGKKEGALGTVPDPASFENPEDQDLILAFLTEYGPSAGVPVPPIELLQRQPADTLRKLAGEVYRKARPVFLGGSGGRGPANREVSKLNIPSVIE